MSHPRTKQSNPPMNSALNPMSPRPPMNPNRDGNARVTRNASPASAHKDNRAPSIVLTIDPGRWHAPGADGPHHAPTATQTYHIQQRTQPAPHRVVLKPLL
ncbi:hypothetical protein ILYODFUR_027521 [Ilyodon furcidens]|uniref:Uncharacterized protein n=1 Tax=Ilyodon furcidens TaxID=33524 RepID=A0ABV0VIB6_9TELE